MRNPKRIIISGTPGTGKTTISKKLTKILDAECLSLNEITIAKKYVLKYDEVRDTYVADFEKLIPHIIRCIEKATKQEKHVIIEGHFADVIPNEYIDLVVVLRCNPDKLKERLEERDYKPQKVKENLQAEILGDSMNYIIKKNLKVPILELDTSKYNINELSELIFDIMKEKVDHKEYLYGNIDWLSWLCKENRFIEFFD